MLAGARGYLGHDTGISHLAAACGVDCVLLFGPTEPAVWAPRNPGVTVLRAPDGRLDRLAVATVVAAVRDAGRMDLARCLARLTSHYPNVPMPMSLTPNASMLAGLYLARFDRDGLEHLGFASFSEAYNVLGFVLGAKPTTVKNYMQEFDPFFPNQRKGWHGRPPRPDRVAAMEEYAGYSIEEFARLLRGLGLPGDDEEIVAVEEKAGLSDGLPAAGARRMLTGAAAENYFASVFPTLPQFSSYNLIDVSRLGCGFDFKATCTFESRFRAFEVKGLSEPGGGIQMTEKEYRVAGVLQERYYLAVVSNFRETPCLRLYQDPIAGGLDFARQERLVTVVTWNAYHQP